MKKCWQGDLRKDKVEAHMNSSWSAHSCSKVLVIMSNLCLHLSSPAWCLLNGLMSGYRAVIDACSIYIRQWPQKLMNLYENGYMYMYGWVPLLFTLKCHNIVNRLYSNIKVKKKKKSQKNPANGPSFPEAYVAIHYWLAPTLWAILTDFKNLICYHTLREVVSYLMPC